MANAWDRLAEYRDGKTGDRGDLWHRALIDPAVRHLVGPVRGLRVLEIACGNGYLAREFARRGARRVVGVDRSNASIRLALRRERTRPQGVRFEVGDASHLRFGDGAFDLVVANMALMDIADAAGAVREAARVLVPGGRFVFSISHPCFDLDDRSVWSVERGFGPDGVFRDTVYRKVSGYRDERKSRSPWRVDPHTVVWTVSFHRTLSTYVRYLRAAGFAVTGLEEPLPQREMLAESPQGPFLREIPLHLVVEAVRGRAATPGSRTRVRSRAAGGRRSGSRGRSGRTGSGRRGSSRGS
jgi:ubiquinone/menaquinone biosynthesis C-methylase UbiE